MFKKVILLLCLSSLALTSCYRQATKTVVPASFACTAAYRSSVYTQIESKQSITLSAENPNAELAFTDLVFHAMYYDSPYEGRFIKLWATTTDSTDEITSVLFQLSRTTKVPNQILEHGFTGLHYVYHPGTRSELQFWCASE